MPSRSGSGWSFDFAPCPEGNAETACGPQPSRPTPTLVSRGESALRHPEVPHVASLPACAAPAGVARLLRLNHLSAVGAPACFVGEEELWNEYKAGGPAFRFAEYLDGQIRKGEFWRSPEDFVGRPQFRDFGRELRVFFDGHRPGESWAIVVRYDKAVGAYVAAKHASTAYRENRGTTV